MIHHPLRVQLLAIALAALAGFVDAVGFIGSGGFFVSFMSGNTTRMGVGMAERIDIAIFAFALIVSFVIGVALSSLIRRLVHTPLRRAVVLGWMTIMLAAACVVLTVVPGGSGFVVLAVAMGGMNLVLETEGDARIGLTYMTGTLVRLGNRLADALAGKANPDTIPLLSLWVALATGAGTGAFAHGAFGMKALWIAVVVGLILTIWKILAAPTPDRSEAPD